MRLRSSVCPASPYFSTEKKFRVSIKKSHELWWKTVLHNVHCIVHFLCSFYVFLGRNKASVYAYFFPSSTRTLWFTNVFILSSFLAFSFLCVASIPSISLRPLPLFMLYLSHPLSVSGSSTSPCGAGVGQRRWGWGWWAGEAGVWASSGGGRGCLSASEPLTRAWFMAQGAPIGTGLEVLCLTAPQRE